MKKAKSQKLAGIKYMCCPATPKVGGDGSQQVPQGGCTYKLHCDNHHLKQKWFSTVKKHTMKGTNAMTHCYKLHINKLQNIIINNHVLNIMKSTGKHVACQLQQHHTQLRSTSIDISTNTIPALVFCNLLEQNKCCHK